MSNNKALVILSGGQDSTTCLFMAIREYNEVHAITFDYGQKHAIEIESAVRVAKMAKVSTHEIVKIPDCLVSSSPLLSGTPLEKYENASAMEKVIGDRVELTFVPMRNTFFFTIAMNRAVALKDCDIITGICEADNANYPDCTEDFRVSLQQAFRRSLGLDPFDQFLTYSIVAPLMYSSKAETVRIASAMPDCWDALAYTHTSYDGKYPPTDNNHANILRADGFEKAGLPDPLVVRAFREGLMPLPETESYRAII